MDPVFRLCVAGPPNPRLWVSLFWPLLNGVLENSKHQFTFPKFSRKLVYT